MKPSTILKKARKLIERGWCKFSYRRRDGRITSFCSSGAITFAGGGDSRADARWFFVRAIGGAVVTEWNDAPHRRKPQVLRAFDRAIKLAQSEE